MQQQRARMQQQQKERQQKTQQPHGGCTQTAWIERDVQQQQSDMRWFDSIETLSGGEDQWQNWSWQIKMAVSGMNGDAAEIMNAAETDGVRNIEEILKDDTLVDANIESCIKAGGESCTVFPRGPRALRRRGSSTIVTGAEGVQSRSRLHATYSGFRVQRECTYPKRAKKPRPR